MQQLKQTLEIIAVHSEFYHLMMNNQHLIVTLVPGIKLWLIALPSSYRYFYGLKSDVKRLKPKNSRNFFKTKEHEHQSCLSL